VTAGLLFFIIVFCAGSYCVWQLQQRVNREEGRAGLIEPVPATDNSILADTALAMPAAVIETVVQNMAASEASVPSQETAAAPAHLSADVELPPVFDALLEVGEALVALGAGEKIALAERLLPWDIQAAQRVVDELMPDELAIVMADPRLVEIKETIRRRGEDLVAVDVSNSG
jgi:hypothetical protein